MGTQFSLVQPAQRVFLSPPSGVLQTKFGVRGSNPLNDKTQYSDTPKPYLFSRIVLASTTILAVSDGIRSLANQATKYTNIPHNIEWILPPNNTLGSLSEIVLALGTAYFATGRRIRFQKK
jgi:hypothetical protein